jgi:hypothetical protein
MAQLDASARQALEAQYNNELTALLVTEGQLRAVQDAERQSRLASYRILRDSHWATKVARVARVFAAVSTCLMGAIFTAMMTTVVLLGRENVEAKSFVITASRAFFAFAVGIALSVANTVGFAHIGMSHAKRLVEMDGRGPCPRDE